MVFKEKPLDILEYLKNKFTNWTSGNEKIDDFIQERQLEINDYDDDIVLEWIPYNQFDEIKEIDEQDLITIYSAKWKNGPLHWDESSRKYKRNQDINVILKCLRNTDELLNEVNFFISLFLELFL